MVLHQSQILPRECSRLVGNGDFISLSVNLKVLLIERRRREQGCCNAALEAKRGLPFIRRDF